MKRTAELPSILVVQARNIPEKIKSEQAHVKAFRQRVHFEPIFINPLMDEPRLWRTKEVLRGRHVGVILMGTSTMDHSKDTEQQQQFNELALPVIIEALESDMPMFGICYGDQAMAIAAGGVVARDNDRMETETASLTIINEHTIFEGQPDPPLVISGHKDSVIVLPNGATRLAKTRRDPNSIWVMRGNKFATQSHPDETKVAGLLAAIELSRDSKLGAYVQTGELFDTPKSDLMIVRYLEGCVNGELWDNARAWRVAQRISLT